MLMSKHFKKKEQERSEKMITSAMFLLNDGLSDFTERKLVSLTVSVTLFPLFTQSQPLLKHLPSNLPPLLQRDLDYLPQRIRSL